MLWSATVVTNTSYNNTTAAFNFEIYDLRSWFGGKPVPSSYWLHTHRVVVLIHRSVILLYASLPLRAWQAVVVVDKLHRPNYSSGGDEETQDLVIRPQLYQEGG